MQFTLPSIVSENDFCRHIIAHSKNEGREFFVTGMVLQAWNALRWSRHCRQSNGGAVLREARADGSPSRA